MKALLLSSLALGLIVAACSAPPTDSLLGGGDPQSDGTGAGGSSTTGTGSTDGTGSGGSDGGSGSGGGDSGTTGGGGSDAGTSGSGGATNVFSSEGAFTATAGPSGHHNAGRECLSCHDGTGGAPNFVFAGTIYNASGAAVAGAEIRVEDSAGHFVSVYSASNGNFYQEASGSFAAPGHAGARNASTSNLMTSNVTNGACNSCHCTGTGCATTPLHLP